MKAAEPEDADVGTARIEGNTSNLQRVVTQRVFARCRVKARKLVATVNIEGDPPPMCVQGVGAPVVLVGLERLIGDRHTARMKVELSDPRFRLGYLPPVAMFGTRMRVSLSKP